MLERLLLPVHKEWAKYFRPEYFDLAQEIVQNIVKSGVKCNPDNPSKILKFLEVSPDNLKVVIVGQD